MSSKKITGKTPSESAVTKTEIVLPQHTNALGTIFGGTVMSWIDIAAAIAAERHARSLVVTASVDALHFIAPLKSGDIALVQAQVNYTHKTSMEVGVRVEVENPLTGERHHCVTAYTTFVSVNDQGKPQPVIPVLPQTELEKKRYEQAKKRRESRIRLKKEFESSHTES